MKLALENLLLTRPYPNLFLKLLWSTENPLSDFVTKEKLKNNAIPFKTVTPGSLARFGPTFSGTWKAPFLSLKKIHLRWSQRNTSLNFSQMRDLFWWHVMDVPLPIQLFHDKSQYLVSISHHIAMSSQRFVSGVHQSGVTWSEIFGPGLVSFGLISFINRFLKIFKFSKNST